MFVPMNEQDAGATGMRGVLWGVLATVSSALLLGTANFLLQTSTQLSVLQEQVKLTSEQIQKHEDRIRTLEIKAQ